MALSLDALLDYAKQSAENFWIGVRRRQNEEKSRTSGIPDPLMCMCSEINKAWPSYASGSASCVFDNNRKWRPLLVVRNGISANANKLNESTDHQQFTVEIKTSMFLDHWFRPLDDEFQTAYDYENPLYIKYEPEPRYEWCRGDAPLFLNAKRYEFTIFGVVGSVAGLSDSFAEANFNTNVWACVKDADSSLVTQRASSDEPLIPLMRARGDRYVLYGDGGEDVLSYPIWISKVEPTLCKTFAEQLHALNEVRNDTHDKEPLDDIIDPNLEPAKFSSLNELFRYAAPKKEYDSAELLSTTRATRAFYIQKLLQRQARLQSEGNWKQADNGSTELANEEARSLFSVLSDAKVWDDEGAEQDGDADTAIPGTLLRQTMHWIPSRITVDGADRVSIASPIHQLPNTTQNKSLYRCFEQMLAAALPSLRKLGLAGRDTSLQVIFKAQSYDMRANSSYSGHWHVEGLTENIVAVLSFYPHISPHLSGGALRFRPPIGPSEYYDECGSTVDVPVNQGDLVVFSNVMPHRVRRITYADAPPGAESQRRTFVTAFIVDPLRPIPGTSTNDNNNDDSDGSLSAVPMCSSRAEAITFRANLRALLGTERHGWGFVHYGNCGTTRFAKSVAQMEASTGFCGDASSTLQHTDSSNSP